MKALKFIKIAIKDYKRVGAVTVSSHYTVRRIAGQLKPSSKYVIEYGAGNGVITKAILKRLPSDGILVAIELNRELFRELSKINDRRLVVLNKNIINVSRDFSTLNLPRIDAVISGVPFSFIRPSERVEVVSNTHEELCLGGRFIVYQTSLLMLPVLKNSFGKIKKLLELRNFPPYFIMVAEK